MIATIVNASQNAAQIWAGIAFICAAIYTVWSLFRQEFPTALLGAAVAFAALALMWGLAG